MGYIFISYSHEDREYALRLADALHMEGFEIWIDDRIDYGSQWPLAIETAIDHCDGFILIASKNSHRSEWVQHEVARAKRLKKQFFPLLLNGDPWLSFESTQYFDVRGGDLPSQNFYATLRNSESQRYEVIRNLLIDDWPKYHNAKYGFSFCYPLDGKILENEENSARIDLPVLEGTNLKEKCIAVYCREGGVLSSPLNIHNPVRGVSYDINILGLRFLREGGWNGAMNKVEEWISYSTLRENKVITISLIMTSISHELYLPVLLPRIDLAAEQEVLLYVLSTFTWLD